MSQPVGDLIIDLSLDAVRFDEQMSRVRRHFSGLDTDARKTASAVETGPEPPGAGCTKSRDFRRAV
ncbi:tail component of prophage CP-933R [Escherichia coli]|nr:tail component of prophage CP-933R [Escherichia coli]